MMRLRSGALGLWALLLTCLIGLAAPAAVTSAQTVPGPAPSPSAAPSAPAKSPFGLAPPGGQRAAPARVPENAGLLERLSFWVQDKQSEYTRGLVQAVRRLKTDNLFVAAGALAILSFLYGVFHAVGPGHGKAIISSYVLANEQTARRGVLIAFLSSAFQALSAIVIVGLMALVFKATSVQMQAAESMIERISYALVTAVGAWLLFVQIRALITGKPAHSHAGHDHKGHAHEHGHAGHGHAHGHAHAHAAGEACDHQHLPGPEQLTNNWSWKRALALSFAVGVRPCTGAILVLVFALTQGLFWAGVFATVAMALGTAITVSALAVLAVVSRDWAAGLTDGRGRWMDRVHTLAGLAGSSLVFVMGALLLWGSFGPARPF